MCFYHLCLLGCGGLGVGSGLCAHWQALTVNFVLNSVFERGFGCVAQAGLELAVYLSLPFQLWDCRRMWLYFCHLL